MILQIVVIHPAFEFCIIKQLALSTEGNFRFLSTFWADTYSQTFRLPSNKEPF